MLCINLLLTILDFLILNIKQSSNSCLYACIVALKSFRILINNAPRSMLTAHSCRIISSIEIIL